MPTRYRIAIVEGDVLIFRLLERWLTAAGHEVAAVTIDDLQRSCSADIVIADAPSPRSASALVASLQAPRKVPIILISARFRRGQGAGTALAQQLGVAAVLPKPFTRADLLAALGRAIR